MVSSPCVQMEVHLPSRAMSPRMTRSLLAHRPATMWKIQTIHENGLRDVVSIVTSDYVVDVQYSGAPVQGLSSEDAAECAVILLANLSNDGVHCPPIEFVVRQNLQRHVVLLLIALYSLQ